MKELSIEEKALRYDGAIKRAEKYYKEGKTLYLNCRRLLFKRFDVELDRFDHVLWREDCVEIFL